MHDQNSDQLARIKQLFSKITTGNYSPLVPHDIRIGKSALTGKRLDLDSRQADIEEMIHLSRQAGRRSEERFGWAALIAAIAHSNPDGALNIWDKQRELILQDQFSRAIAYCGLFVAFGQLQQPVRAQHFRAFAQALLEEFHEQERATCGQLARIEIGDEPEPDRSPAPGTSEPSSASALSTWLHSHKTLTLGTFGNRFEEFVTNDKSFVQAAEAHAERLKLQIQQGLTKPANYLLQASPGAGKSHFVRQFAARLLGLSNVKGQYLERNLSAYSSVDHAFQDIVLDVLLATARHKPVVLFVDEVDTEIDGKHIFQKLLAPMNGDAFFFLGKQLSFAQQNLVVCYALSGSTDTLKAKPKWLDFESRIPRERRIILPIFDSPFERLFRAIDGFVRHSRRSADDRHPIQVSHQALLFVGLASWASARDLDQAVEMALLRRGGPNRPLELEHLVQDPSAIIATERERGIRILGIDDFYVTLIPKPPTEKEK